MSSTHTPGPWHVGGKDNQIVYDAKGMPVASATTYFSFDDDTMRANADLIASAPELLDVIEAFMKVCSSRWRALPLDSYEKQTLSRAFTVIAQATGAA